MNEVKIMEKLISELFEGDILAEDIYANTKHPILVAGEKLTPIHIQILKKFDIQKMLIEERENKDEPIILKQEELDYDSLKQEVREFIVAQQIINEDSLHQKHTFINEYEETMKKYKNEMVRLRLGNRVNVPYMRQLLVPLLELYIKEGAKLEELKKEVDVLDYTYHQAIQASLSATTLAIQLNFSTPKIFQIALAALLMNIGESEIPLAILNKVEQLDQVEEELIRNHPIRSYELILNTPLLQEDMKTAILQHHEKLNGSGYPYGIKYLEVQDITRILSVADVFCALTMRRPYRERFSPYVALEIMRYREYGKYYLPYIDEIEKNIGKLDVGVTVQLTNQTIVVVIQMNPENKYLPQVKDIETGRIIDLSKSKERILKKM